jgi:hypothetical protein
MSEDGAEKTKKKTRERIPGLPRQLRILFALFALAEMMNHWIRGYKWVVFFSPHYIRRYIC